MHLLQNMKYVIRFYNMYFLVKIIFLEKYFEHIHCVVVIKTSEVNHLNVVVFADYR